MKYLPEQHFDSLHDEAFDLLGARKPGRHWSAFDVPLGRARKGEAGLLVTTIWNYHSRPGAKDRPEDLEVAINRNKEDGTLWYRVAKPKSGKTTPTWSAHWNRLELARKLGIPIVGILKEVHSGRCAISCLFRCSVHMQLDGRAMWLGIEPEQPYDGEVNPIDMRKYISCGWRPGQLSTIIERFEQDVIASQKTTSELRKARLAKASKFPKRVEVTSYAFIRNPDVVAEVLYQAQGLCERCHSPAPFLRCSDSSPYLEVHHRKPLAEGGEDTVENAIALCPNCHRQSHYGV